MTKFLIRSARELLVGSWIALMFGAYLAISEANRLADAASISDVTRYAIIGTAVLTAIIYTSICGTALVMFGVHDRLSEISKSLALVADRFCDDDWNRGASHMPAVDPADHRSIADKPYPAAHAEDQPVSLQQSWWSDASFGQKAAILFIVALPIIMWWMN